MCRKPFRKLNLQQLEDRTVPAFGLGWALNLGSSATWAKGIGIAVDGSANVYVSGFYSGTVDFDPNNTNPGSSQVLTSTGYYGNNFAAKYLADGTFQWVTDLGITAQGAPGETIAVQGENVFVGYPTATPAVDPDDAAAVSRLDAANGAIAWTTTLTTGGNVRVGVAAGPGGSVYATGDINQSQVFVSRLDAAGNVDWMTTSNGGSNNRGISLAVDGAGNAYATGHYTGTVAFGSKTLTSWSNTTDAFIWKLNATGATTWAGSMGSNGADLGEGITLDGEGNVLVSGMWGYGTSGSKNNNFNPNSGTAVKLTNNGSYDIFVAKLTPAANGGLSLLWAKNIGGTSDDRGLAVAADAAGNVYTTGSFSGTVNFNPNGGTKRNLTSSGGFDIFVSKLSSSGNYVDAAGFGSAGTDFGRSITADGAGNVYTIGCFVGTVDFSPNGTYNLAANGNQDAFVAKFTQSSPLVAANGPSSGQADLLTNEQLQPILAAAIKRWAVGGLSADQMAVMQQANASIADLGGAYLGQADTFRNAIVIDDDAAGYGWFVDPTPINDAEFVNPRIKNMDLLSVVTHELGHLVGLEHDDGGVMEETLAPGMRTADHMHYSTFNTSFNPSAFSTVVGSAKAFDLVRETDEGRAIEFTDFQKRFVIID